jgi:hypothetical protein
MDESPERQIVIYDHMAITRRENDGIAQVEQFLNTIPKRWPIIKGLKEVLCPVKINILDLNKSCESVKIHFPRCKYSELKNMIRITYQLIDVCLTDTMRVVSHNTMCLRTIDKQSYAFIRPSNDAMMCVVILHPVVIFSTTTNGDKVHIQYTCFESSDGVKSGNCDGVKSGNCDGVKSGNCDGVKSGNCDGVKSDNPLYELLTPDGKGYYSSIMCNFVSNALMVDILTVLYSTLLNCHVMRTGSAVIAFRSDQIHWIKNPCVIHGLDFHVVSLAKLVYNVRICHQCGADNAKRCAGCKTVRYCSLKCQKLHRREHRLYCYHFFGYDTHNTHTIQTTQYILQLNLQ